MHISDTAIKNRMSVLVLVFIILFIGSSAYKKLPRESSPDITIPFVFVQTEYRGALASDIETAITVEIEKRLKGLDKVKNISSVSSQGVSRINIEFLPGTDIDEVLPKVKDKVDEARNDLPSDLESDPSVFEVDFSKMPIVVYSLFGEASPARLKKIADDLKDEIETIPGILEVDITGGSDREIRIEVDPDKLAYYKIPINALERVIATENQNTSGGAITLGDGRYQLKVPGEFETPEEILLLVVATYDGKLVYLKDVAKLVDSVKEETSYSRLDGVTSVSISIKKRAGENIIHIANNVDAVIEKAKQLFPENIHITKLMDEAKNIRLMVADLENNIFSGLVLVVSVLFFFLGFRNALLVGLAIPLSMMLSFVILDFLGYTLNIIVLFSLTLALGMIVDNAIVIIENIYRYMQQGVPRIQAAMKATAEVAWPIIGSTFTTLAAFFPMIFWPGIMGEFMKYLPITLIITLSSSLFVALVINPVMCVFFMKLSKNIFIGEEKSEEKSEGKEAPVKIEGFVLVAYSKLLKKALNNKAVVLVSSFACLIVFFQIWYLSIGIEKPIEFFPPLDPVSAYVNVEIPEGASLDFIDKKMKEIEKKISGSDAKSYFDAMQPLEHEDIDGTKFMALTDINNIEHIYSKVALSSENSVFDSNLPNHIGIQFIDFERRKTPTKNDLEILRKRLKDIAGVKITINKQQEGPPTGPPINIEISGDDFEQLNKIAQKIKNQIKNIDHIKDLSDDYQGSLPSLEIKIDRQKAAFFKLNTASVGNALKTAYNGLDISTYYEKDEGYDIIVMLSKQDREAIDVLNTIMLSTPSNTLVPLSTIADIRYKESLGNIVRKNHERVVTVKANVDEANTTGPIVRNKAHKLLAGIDLPLGYTYKFTGENESQKESEEFLKGAFMAALFLIFLILVTLFNSLIQPAIILVSVFLSFGGAFWGLAIISSPFGIIMTGVGIISLAGVVVNNAIVLIDYTNKLVKRGMDISDAVMFGGATRLRPVLLTAVTTILGLLPMVTGISYDFHVMSVSTTSESSQWWQSMAIVVIFGLMLATLLTLVVVPTLYALFEEKKKLIFKKQ